MKVKQKPIVFDAIQWKPGVDLPPALKTECYRGALVEGQLEGGETHVLHTPYGPVKLVEGSWILIHPDGSLATVPAEVFAELFEEVFP